MAFYTANDLSYRRSSLIQLLSSLPANKVTNHYFYGNPMTGCCLKQIEYLTACMEVIECYTPITSEDEDGETNCLEEADLDSIFDNISKLTGICFQPKGTTYNETVPDEETTTLTLNTGSLTLNTLEPITHN
jgi:hypothetical protein